MLTLFTTATAVLILVVIYQERKFKDLQGLVLSILREVCNKLRPVVRGANQHENKKSETATDKN